MIQSMEWIMITRTDMERIAMNNNTQHMEKAIATNPKIVAVVVSV